MLLICLHGKWSVCLNSTCSKAQGSIICIYDSKKLNNFYASQVCRYYKLPQPVVLALRLTLRGVIKKSIPVLQGRKGRLIVIDDSYQMPSYRAFSG